MIDMSSVFKIKPADKVFIDTNILIFLFAPSYVKKKKDQVEKYSAIVTSLVQKKCDLYINSHVVSEFINRCLRIDFDNNYNKNKDKNYKQDYRNSEEYLTTIHIVLKQLKKFLKFANHINDDFESFNISKAYETKKESDFNDLIIADTVIKNQLKLLSDDADFNDSLGINTNWYL